MEDSTLVRKYVRDFRSLVEETSDVLSHLGEKADELLREGEEVAEYLSPLIEQFMTTLSLERISDNLKAQVFDRSQALVYYGLFTHCLLLEAPNRMNQRDVDLEALYTEWIVESLTANSGIRDFDKDMLGYPSALFEVFYKEEFEPLQKQLKLGWWKRLKNANKFKNFFASGVLLGMLFDIEKHKVAETNAQKEERVREVDKKIEGSNSTESSEYSAVGEDMARERPKTFTCALCQDEFEDDGTYTEEEAKILAKAKYPDAKEEDMVDLCPDCAREIEEARREESEGLG